MPTTTEAQNLVAYLEARLPTYLDELRRLCAIECPSASKAGVDQAGAWVRNWATGRGWGMRVWHDAEAGDGVLFTLRGGARRGPRLLLAAHLDTVYALGTAADRPARLVDDRFIGPGAADNKSGLLSGLYAMAALEDLGLTEHVGAIALFCGGDEETDMRVSLAILREIAPKYDCALVLEAARENGDIVGARKGIGSWLLDVQGHAAHAGVEPHRGANAILALAQQIVALQLLNGSFPGVTLNVGQIGGGGQTNVIAERAWAEFEARVVRAEDMAPIGAAIGRIAAAPPVPNTAAALSGGWRSPPMARTPAIARLAALAKSCAQELDFTVEDAATGGISYANALASLGLPVLDGLGPIGGLDHSPDEYILVSSIVPRTALLALLILRRAAAEQPDNIGVTAE